MNGIVENLVAAGVLAGGQRLVDVLTGGEGELRKACRAALVEAVTDTVHPRSDEERGWLVQVIDEGLVRTTACRQGSPRVDADRCSWEPRPSDVDWLGRFPTSSAMTWPRV
jgi:hypothetical protein